MTLCYCVRRNLFALVLALAAQALFLADGQAQSVAFNDFSDTSGLQLNGNAAPAATADGHVLQLTPAAFNQAGSAFLQNPVPLGTNVSFSTFFSFRLSHGGGGTDVDGVPGADGIVFVVQSVANNVGSLGGGIGYLGISNSIGVEFDTWYNNGNPTFDPQLPNEQQNTNGSTGDGNHLALGFDGTLDGAVETHITNPMNNGNVWYSWIDYNGASGSLEVRLSETPTRPSTPTLTNTVDLLSHLGTTNAYFGFTAATGGAYNQQDILSWQLNTQYQPIGGTITMQPTNQTRTAGSTAIFVVSVSGDPPFSYQWLCNGTNLTDNGRISGSESNVLTVASVFTNDTGSYSVLVSNSFGTVSSLAATLEVELPPPSISCAPDRTIECGVGWDFDPPNASATCNGTNVTVVATGTITNAMCGNTFEAIRTWQATDDCGLSVSCTQKVTVVDTTPPVITCAGNRNVECGTAWTFDEPSASDICSGTNVAITVLSTITNQLVGQTFRATRTWVATDPCGNSNLCSQIITIIDTIAPQISCSSNLIVECAGPGGIPVLFTTTATDACDTNVTLVCVPPSGSLFALGTNTVVCTATDDSANSNVCSFTVTVLDTTPPQILCPPNMNVAEAPRDSGFATNVVFPAPIATDVCDDNLLVYCTPPSGSTFPVGTNPVVCTAVDHSGNTNTCALAIRVIPYRLPVTVTSAADSGPSTLRQALLDANDSPDENLIVFNLPGPTPDAIHLLSALPELTSPIIIDGWSQPGFTGSPLIELDGSTASNAIDGLVIRAGSSTVRGLAFHGFTMALRLENAGNNVIQGNFIGTDLTGTNALGNSGDGIFINSPQNLIGGTTAEVANLIAFNGRNGITVAAGAGHANALLGNRIFSNNNLGIDLGENGVTPNDGDDSDDGPNGYQNFPVLTDALSADGVIKISGQLASAANTTFRIEFFLNDNADPSGYGEGQVYLGSMPVITDASGSATFTAGFPINAVFTQFITATATDPANNTSEFSLAQQVRTPPVIQAQPVSTTNVPPGTSVVFFVAVDNSSQEPLVWQWRLNGFNIPGATSSSYTTPPADLTNAGTYSALVENSVGAISALPVSLTIGLTNVPGGDHFSNRVSLSGLRGTIAGQNRNATKEPGEPLHAGKVGGKSLWYTWQAPVTGVATFRTRGSTFDTLLAIYTGTVLSNLTAIDSDEDRGGFYTSRTDFNAVRGARYEIAVDGFGGEEGDYVLDWSEQDTQHLLPRFRVQPLSRTVAPGANVTFTAVAVRVCGNGHEDCPDPTHYPEGTLPALSYQWYFYDSPIAGATSNSLTLNNVRPGVLGNYSLRVSTAWQTSESQTAVLQINLTGSDVEPVQAVDKFLDAVNPLLIGAVEGAAVLNGDMHTSADTVVHGYTGMQLFNTVGSATGPGEVICGVIGGASEWISFVPEASGTLFLNTDGSSYDTVMAVYRRSPTNLAVLELLACDNNSGTNGLTSALSIPVEANKTNYIVVDGVSGLLGIASGSLQLNYSLATTTILKFAGKTPAGAQHIQVLGHANLHFALQGSTNLSTWTTLISTNSPGTVFDYIDNDSINIPKRYYRALLLP